MVRKCIADNVTLTPDDKFTINIEIPDARYLFKNAFFFLEK